MAIYTPEQANEALPLVGRIVRDLVEAYQRLTRDAAHAEVVREQWEGKRPGVVRRSSDRVEETRLRCGALLEELDQVGVLMRDLEAGRVDFPALVCGGLGYLCWQLDEDLVTHGHLAGEGCSERRRVVW